MREERECDLLACRAFSSLPTTSEIMWLSTGIPVKVRNSCTRCCIAVLRHASFFETKTEAAGREKYKGEQS